MDYEKLEKRFYDKIWHRTGDWKKRVTPYTNKKPKIEGKLIGDFLKKNLKKNSKILDLGCGGGRLSVMLASQGFQVHGVDFSKYAIKLANKLKKEKRVEVKFRHGSALNLKYDEDFFNAVLDIGCFHHLRKSQWKKYLKNLMQVLKKNGYYLLYTFSVESDKKLRKQNWRVRTGHYYHYFSKNEIKDYFGKFFEILKVKTIKEPGRRLVFYLSFMRKV